MKDFLLLTAVALSLTFGVTVLPAQQDNLAQITLPEVQITAKRALPGANEVQLPTGTNPDPMVYLTLPEVVITTTRLPKV